MDWAIKRLLRNKANFVVFEGFLSQLLFDNIKIKHILEIEGNQESDEDKFTRIDFLTRNSKNELIIIEIQFTILDLSQLDLPIYAHKNQEQLMKDFELLIKFVAQKKDKIKSRKVIDNFLRLVTTSISLQFSISYKHLSFSNIF